MYNIIRSWLHDNSQFGIHTEDYLDGLVQERRNSSALAMELYMHVFLALNHRSWLSKNFSSTDGSLPVYFQAIAQLSLDFWD